ncbi:MAG TPA: hypothetical protein VFE01_06215 [Terracidiphilus sp.]|jgi:hypothetical protein|nr:hypothetical protein [Terracidiphilus sp.]
MKSGPVHAISLALIPAVTLLAAGLNVRAQNTSVPPDVKAFAAQYVAAYNSKDLARLESMYLPQSRTCVTPANREFYNSIARQMSDEVAPGYLLSLMPVNEGNMKAFASEMYFLVKPERELHIDYQYPGTNDGGQLVLSLIRQNGRWMADFPCMTAHAIKDYQDNAAAREHYKAIAAAIKQPLRSQLLAMLRAHKLGEAETRYQQVTGGDMRTAMLVVSALKDQGR